MKYGYCVNMIAKDKDGIGYQWIPELKQVGFDYVELPLAQMMALTERDFYESLLGTLKESGLPCLSCNNFFPGAYQLTGPQADHQRALAYAQAALTRAAMLGAKRVVFGSAGARNMPVGFPKDAALKQLSQLLRSLGDIAKHYDITLVIEPLNISESNLIHYFSQGVALARQTNHANVKVLLDSYHMRLGNEPWDSLLSGGEYLQHVHVARPLYRSLPTAMDGEDYQGLFNHIKQIGYDGTVSIEAYLRPGQTGADMASALQYLSSQAV